MKRLVVACLIISLVVILGAVAWTQERRGGNRLPLDLDFYTYIGSFAMPDTGSPIYGMHHFYMNKRGFDAFKKRTVYPDGTIIVGKAYDIVPAYDGMNEGKQIYYTYMRKESRTKEAKETGGWIFDLFNAEGTPMERDLKDCFACHLLAKDSD